MSNTRELSAVELVPMGQIQMNPENPRTITKQKFAKLKKSIKDFPDMLYKRPLIIDEDGVVLGGNMRLLALKDLRYKEVPAMRAIGWTEEQKREFVVKDNVGFGDWDWDELANGWDEDKLNDWGLEVPVLNEQAEIDEQELEFSEYLDESHNYVVLLFDNDIDWLSAQTHFELKSVYSKRQNGKAWSKGIGRVLNGAEYLKRVTGE
jgi:hypothetical protein